MNKQFKITIRENSTGKQVHYIDEWYKDIDQEDLKGIVYQWSDGNFGCDCNRKSFFYYQSKNIELSDEESPCGGSAYSVSLHTMNDKLIFSDM